MKGANPYLNFAGNTKEAFEFYRSVLGGDFLAVLRFRDFGDNRMGVPENQLDRIAHIALPLGGGNILMGTDQVDGQPPLEAGNNFSIALEAETEQEAEKVFDGLAEGGKYRDATSADRVGREVRHVQGPVRHPVDGQLHGERGVPGSFDLTVARNTLRTHRTRGPLSIVALRRSGRASCGNVPATMGGQQGRLNEKAGRGPRPNLAVRRARNAAARRGVN